MSEFLFVGGPLHGQVRDIYSHDSIEPIGSIQLAISIDNEVFMYERSDYSRWKGPHYRVAVLPGECNRIQQTIDETGYQPIAN
ncbi:hypothetical protein [Klebsiella aerogenes]|uniref:hypothetical protein n=1 Tax=Klebsiella aerogenes TaxID=548 RepID=UPI001BD00601|nr:hypothetical protein [Klebsiella aerogenes]